MRSVCDASWANQTKALFLSVSRRYFKSWCQSSYSHRTLAHSPIASQRRHHHWYTHFTFYVRRRTWLGLGNCTVVPCVFMSSHRMLVPGCSWDLITPVQLPKSSQALVPHTHAGYSIHMHLDNNVNCEPSVNYCMSSPSWKSESVWYTGMRLYVWVCERALYDHRIWWSFAI